MERAIYQVLSKQLSSLLPENVQILPLYSATERDSDLVKIGISPAGPVAIGTPFRLMSLTLAAGVRRRLPDANDRLRRIFSVLQNYVGSGNELKNIPVTGHGMIDAIQATPGEPYALGTDDTEEYLVASIQAKIYFTKN